MTLSQDIAGFRSTIRAHTRRLGTVELLKFQQDLALGVLGGVVARTPVDTGYARNNWQTALGAEPSSSTQVPPKPPKPKRGKKPTPIASTAAERGLNTVGQARPFGDIWVFNNVEYIVALEDGHSKQFSGQGMLAPTLAELEGKMRAGRP